MAALSVVVRETGDPSEIAAAVPVSAQVGSHLFQTSRVSGGTLESANIAPKQKTKKEKSTTFLPEMKPGKNHYTITHCQSFFVHDIKLKIITQMDE